MPSKAMATWQILCDQGKTFTRSITYKVNGVPFDNTGLQARMQARRNYSSALPSLDLNSQVGTMTLGGVTGTISWDVSAVIMEALSGDYVYDVELYDPNDEDIVYGVVRGTLCVRSEATR